MPEHAVISDDAVTAGLPSYMQTKGARPHDWLMLTGGAIGQGIPADQDGQHVAVAVGEPAGVAAGADPAQRSRFAR